MVHKEKAGFIHMVETFTSQTCNQCKAKNLTNTISAESKWKLYNIFKYSSYNMVWNHDVMAAKNILYTFTYMSWQDNERSPACMNSASSEGYTGFP